MANFDACPECPNNDTYTIELSAKGKARDGVAIRLFITAKICDECGWITVLDWNLEKPYFVN